MAEYELVIDLDKILNQKSHIPNIEKVIIGAFESGVEELSNRLVDKLIDNIIKYDLGNSEMSMGLDIEITDDGVSINVNSEYALFVEYGTGIIGMENPHPNPSKHGWIYDTNEHGDKGWWYPTVSSDPNPYKWTNEFGTLYAWTRGIPSRPFMYDTWLWGSQSANNIITKHINRELRKLESENR